MWISHLQLSLVVRSCFFVVDTTLASKFTEDATSVSDVDLRGRGDPDKKIFTSSSYPCFNLAMKSVSSVLKAKSVKESYI